MSQIASNDTPVTQGVLMDQHDNTLVLGLLGTDHQLHLQHDTEVKVKIGGEQRIAGTIRAKARRVDVVRTGGRYIEPVYGRPRRLQGRIVSIDPIANTITVDCGCPFVCQLMANQKTAAFVEGTLVSFDVERGATFQSL